jgi:prepilin-type N-terminal cleavage/methylation domain-containing protein
MGKFPKQHMQSGFTLVESMIGIAIFVMLAGVVYQTFFVISKEATQNWESTTVTNLASQYLEIARNLPYAQIGTVQGNPHGTLPDSANPVNVTISSTPYQIYYEITYMDDTADGTVLAGTDSSGADYKQVKLSVKNTTTGIITNFVTSIVPTGLESLASGGALSLSIIDAVGQPVPGASINITNSTITPSINLTRTSDANGKWVEVGLPNSGNSYHITVTKSGYSSDQTYAITGGNPSPTKPDATIANGQVTQISFAIDLTSTLAFNTLNQACAAIGSIGLGIKGAKLIGTPNVYKFSNTYTSDGSGQVLLSPAEWDNYTPTLTGTTYMIYGSSPIQQINLLPNTTQMFNLILGAKTANSMLVIVKDGSTGNPIEGAAVRLTSASKGIDSSLITGGSLWSQQLWNAGSGQAAWSNVAKYFQDDGGISTTDTPLAVRLINSGGNTIVNSGWLVSSTFDTGAATTAYTTLNWQPASQDPAATVKFQIATNNDNATWNFIGPDGTASTYYTTPGTTMSTANNGNQYVRYKAYLSTTNSAKNPTLTSVGINYVSGCFTPGQVIFPGLAASGQTGDYQVTTSMAGYASKSVSNLAINGYSTLSVSLTPN